MFAKLIKEQNLQTHLMKHKTWNYVLQLCAQNLKLQQDNFTYFLFLDKTDTENLE